MDYPYNLTSISGTRDIVQFMQEINLLSSGIFGTMIIISFWIILFITFKARQYETQESLAATTIISCIICLLLRSVGLVPDYMMYISIIAVIISFILLYIRE